MFSTIDNSQDSASKKLEYIQENYQNESQAAWNNNVYPHLRGKSIFHVQISPPFVRPSAKKLFPKETISSSSSSVLVKSTFDLVNARPRRSFDDVQPDRDANTRS